MTSVVRSIPLGPSTWGGGTYIQCFPYTRAGSVVSSLPLSFSVMFCSSFDIGPKSLPPPYIDRSPPRTSTLYPSLPRISERMGKELIFVSSSWSSYSRWRVAVPRTVRLSPFILMVFAVSRTEVKSGHKAGRHAARIPVFNSTLSPQLVISAVKGKFQGISLVPNLKRAVGEEMSAQETWFSV